MFNTDIIQGFSIYSAALVPIILSVTQAIKMTGWVKDKFTPFLAIAVGIGISFLLAHDVLNNLSGIILAGILYGLASSGLYSGLVVTKAAIDAENKDKVQKRAEREARKEDHKHK